MPELPELEVLAGNLGRLITANRLSEFAVLKPYIQKTTIPEGLIGQRVIGVRRRGKHICIDLKAHRLVVHLMLKGRFKRFKKTPYRSAAALMRFEDVALELTEEGKLKRMSIWILPRNKEVDDIKPLGPEPLSKGFTVERLADILKASREGLKNFLANQRNLAGIGNAYADEICWHAGLSPFKRAHSLSREDAERLYAAVREVLGKAIEEIRRMSGGRVEFEEKRCFLSVHRRKGKPCPRCGAEIQWVSTASQDTYYCPSCQTGGRILADRRTSRFLK